MPNQIDPFQYLNVPPKPAENNPKPNPDEEPPSNLLTARISPKQGKTNKKPIPLAPWPFTHKGIS